MKKLTAIVALLLCLAMLVGCGDNNTPTTTAGGNAGATDAPATDAPATNAPAKEPVKITWAINDQYTAEVPADDAPIVKLLEEKFNVDIEFWPVAEISNPEQWNTMMGAGEAPDVWENPGTTQKWYEQGLCRTFTMDFLKENAPNLVAHVEALDSVGVAFSANTVTADIAASDDEVGQYFALPEVNKATGMGFMTVMRQDWLDNLGLEVPETLEQFDAVVRAFTFDDPDGNGEDDTYGYTMRNSAYDSHIAWTAYGITQNCWVKDDSGKLVKSYTTEEWKNAVKLYASWVKDGCCSPSWMTDSFDVAVANFANGVTGTFGSSYWWAGTQNPSAPAAMLLANNPDAKIVFVGDIHAEGYEAASINFGRYAGWGIQMRHDVDDEKAALILQIVDFINSDLETAKLAAYGIEGEDYLLKSDGTILKGLSQGEEIIRGIGCWPSWTSDELLDWKLQAPATADQKFALGLKIYEDPTSGLSFPKQNENGWGADLGTLREEFCWNAILGKLDVDAEWENYLQSLKDADMDLIAEEVNEVYAASGRG